MTKNYSNELAAAVKNYLDSQEWHYYFDENSGIILFGLNVSGKARKLRYIIHIDEDDITVCAQGPLGADPDDEGAMERMGMFLHRVNYGMKNGNFEFDPEDGEIRYKTYINCRNTVPSEGIIENSIVFAEKMFGMFFDGIAEIICTDITPEEAYEKCTNFDGMIERLLAGVGDERLMQLYEETERLCHEAEEGGNAEIPEGAKEFLRIMRGIMEEEGAAGADASAA